MWQKTLSDWARELRVGVPTDSVETRKDEPVEATRVPRIPVSADTMAVVSHAPDTCGKRILFFGDSMVEGLSMRFSDYARENGYTFRSLEDYGYWT